MVAKLDLTGQVFNRFRVVAPAPGRGGRAYWACECSCGGTASVSSSNLRSGAVQSCGCLQRERTRASEMVLVLSGEVFGLLTVVGEVPRTERSDPRRISYVCRCVCGSETRPFSADLRAGKAKSCGCDFKSSKAEREILDFVRAHYPDTEHRRRGLLPNKRMELDVWVPSLRAGVEYDGWTHRVYDRVKEIDSRKDAGCSERGIRLLRVSDIEYTKDPAGTLARVLEWFRGLGPA